MSSTTGYGAPPSAPTEDFEPSPRSRVKRLYQRGHYDRETVYAVLDAGLIAHIGYVIDGQPYVTPTAYWREGDMLYWHGSAASRMLEHVGEGIPCTVTVTHLDGLVLARSGFHHSINYRSVMAFGRAHFVEEPEAKMAAFEAFVDRIFPGRWAELRPATKQEVKATSVLGMKLDEASAKIRTGGPVDDDEDYALPIWAGVLPIRTVVGETIPDAKLRPGIERPAHLSVFRADADLDALMTQAAKQQEAAE
ncbi:flavin-nucleotide-binding protein [Hypericibacter adhaerens]|jgi:nitroimidazol reductase NimA-like FMN-containing flavoprotein (pyridoxamine 5'-phosphate oxidase superfamily)|uniref:Flavin-nucleotide-binding protein n=1 Tax=Hypericibacter adhaerens TaxID=2602016 RepID=A0A5J6N5M7_9PROT|nr:pyridoxamine 5'-phosphate oxidase family protein [Hypericibacter adhaerens]QEX25209.1 flavin-nucleotide-binding protein [Hypericibacter adhaerens]